MEDTLGVYESLCGRLHHEIQQSRGGGLPDVPEQLQMLGPENEHPCSAFSEMERMIRALDVVERQCAAMIKECQAAGGPLTSQSDVSECSMEVTTEDQPPAEEDREKRMESVTMSEKCTPPITFIDLTSEDSCDSSSNVSRRRGPESADVAEVQSPLATSMATGVTMLWSPSPPASPVEGSPLKCQIADSPARKNPSLVAQEEPTILSDDDDDGVRYEPYVWTSSQGQEEVGKTCQDEGDDVLAPVWAALAYAIASGGAPAPEPIPTTPIKRKYNKTKRRKSESGGVVFHDVSWERSTAPLTLEVNELEVEVIPTPPLKKPRGRPRKDVDATQDERRRKEPTSNQAKLKEVEQAGVARAQADGLKVMKLVKGKKGRKPKHLKSSEEEEQEKNEKGARKPRGKGDESQEEEEEEEECEQAGKASKGNTELDEAFFPETVDYEPYSYSWRNKEDEDERGAVEELFQEMETAKASTLAPSPEMMATQTCSLKDQGCNHGSVEYDEALGYYCRDCGFRGPELRGCDHSNFDVDEKFGYCCYDCGFVPTDIHEKKKICEHRNFEFREDSGWFCMDCGRVKQDIQSAFLVSEAAKPVRRKLTKEQETVDAIPQSFLAVQDSGTCDFTEANLQLHPYFEEKLHRHQIKGFEFLCRNLFKDPMGVTSRMQESIGCVLAHAPGTGKTCLTVSFIQSFLARFPYGRPLILAPKIMLNSWQTEFDTWKVEEIPIYNLNWCSSDGEGRVDEDEDEEGRLPAPVTKSLKETRLKVLLEWQAGRGVLLMSYALFSILVCKGLEETAVPESLDYMISRVIREAPNLVIMDEGHLARNIKTKISKSLIAMNTKRRVLLSGTLFQNNFKELYTLLKLCRDNFMMSHPQYEKRIVELLPNLHGPNYTERRYRKELMQIEEKIFSEEIGERLERYVKATDVTDHEIECVVQKLQSLTIPFVDWYAGDILKTLPGLFEYSIHLNLTAIQKQTIAQVLGGTQVKSHMSRQCMLLSACIHPSLVNQGDDDPLEELNFSSLPSLEHEAYKGVKMVFLLQLLARCIIAQEKILIFCSTLTPLRYIEDVFSKKWGWHKGQEILRLDGTMQESDRQIVIAEFNSKNSKSRVLLASTKACKEGITLVGASRVVIIDNPDNPAVVRQAVSRAFRMGQKRKVFVYRLVTTNKEEEDIFRRAVNKEILSKVLSESSSRMARMSGFLQEVVASQIEDQLLQKMIEEDRTGYINVVHRYNAAGHTF